MVEVGLVLGSLVCFPLVVVCFSCHFSFFFALLIAYFTNLPASRLLNGKPFFFALSASQFTIVGTLASHHSIPL